MSILELVRLKGNKAVLVIAEGGIRRDRNNLPRHGTRYRSRRSHAASFATLLNSLQRVYCSLSERDRRQVPSSVVPFKTSPSIVPMTYPMSQDLYFRWYMHMQPRILSIGLGLSDWVKRKKIMSS
jgi:hypothetical protein